MLSDSMEYLTPEIMMQIFENNRSTDTLSETFIDTRPIPTINPITAETNDCVLLVNKKKEKYYIHTYEPREILDILSRELNINPSILSRFDSMPREKCCNAISIILYFKDCINKQNYKKYLFSIRRTIKNVQRQLPDWIVRLYLDKSIFDCMNTVNTVLNSRLCDSDDVQYIYYVFNEIKDSENVEIYTFICDSINKKISYEKTRTFRYLVLQDPEVNVCAIRDADGYVTNVDCHNLKIFSKSNRLFYNPIFLKTSVLVSNTGNISYYASYNKWLINYKRYMRNEYYKKNQNIYDFIACSFTTKLKFNKDYYYEHMNSLFKEISKIPNAETLSFNVGFDEIFLLDIYKEITSVNMDEQLDITKINRKRDLLFFADNVKTYIYENSTPVEKVVDDLKELNIIRKDFTLDKSIYDKFMSHVGNEYSIIKFTPETGANVTIPLYATTPVTFIDAYILDEIISTEIFTIILDSEHGTAYIGTALLSNLPCNDKLNNMYDFININKPIKRIAEKATAAAKYKYLKYKKKYINLKTDLLLLK